MPATLRIESPGLDRMAAAMGPQFARRVRAEALRRYAPVLLRKYAEITPRQGPGRTGNMGRSWEVVPDERNGTVAIRNKAAYSGFVDKGTRPHRIPSSGTPGVDRKTLRWRTGRRGPISAFRAVEVQASGRPGALARENFIFMPKAVMHPGTRPQNLVRRGIEGTLGALRDSFQAATRTILATFRGSAGG